MEQDESFDNILDECCRRVRHGEPLELCLADYPPEYQEELARLVSLTEPLTRMVTDPSPEFQARLERELLASVDEAREAQRLGVLARIGRFFSGSPAMRLAAIGLAALALLLGGGFGAVQASENSLPDSPLYQVKTAREWVELALVQSGEGRVVIYVRNVDQRGMELERAARAPKAERLAAPIARRLAESTERMVDHALEAGARGNPQPAARALAAIRTVQQRLDRLTPGASPEVRRIIQRLRSFLEGQEQRLAPV